MYKLSIIVAFFIFINLAYADKEHDFGKWKKVIVLGDSNTQLGYSESGKWISYLSDKLQRKADVVNRGFSGYTTRYVRFILDRVMKEFTPDVIEGVVILLGTNDCSQLPYLYVPVEEYAENLKWMIDYLVEYGVSKEKILLITPGRIEDDLATVYMASYNLTLTHFDANVKKYAQKCAEIADEEGLKYVDLYKLMENSNRNLADFLYDGIHFSAVGGQLLFSHLWPLVESEIVEKGNLQTIYPDWYELDMFNNLINNP